MTNKKLDLNLIQTFLIAAEYQSYTKAAEHLGVTQPAALLRNSIREPNCLQL
ncbi:LysR family transcriptional regulator, partial [Vibrio parahaemolyticus]